MFIPTLQEGMSLQMHNKQTLYKSLHYFAIILLFALGAGLGSYFILFFRMHTIWIPCLLLFGGFSLMFIQEKTEI